MAQSLRFCSAAFPQPQNEHEVVNMLTMSIKNIHDEVIKVHKEKKALRTELSLANERLQALEDFLFLFNSKDSRHKTFLSSSSSFTAAGSPTSLASLASGSSHNSAAGDKQEYPFNGFTASAAEPNKMNPMLNQGSATPDTQVKSPLRSVRTPYVSLVDAILGPAPPSRGPRPEPGSPLDTANVAISAVIVPATSDNTENSETARRTFWIANREIYVSQKRGQAFNTVAEVRFWQEMASRDGLEQSVALKKSQRDAEKVMKGDKKGRKKMNMGGRRWKGKARGCEGC